MSRISRARRGQCMFMLRRAAAGSNINDNFEQLTLVSALMVIIGSDTVDEVPAMPTVDGNWVHLTSGPGKTWLLQLLELALKHAPVPPQETQEPRGSKQKRQNKKPEAVKKRPGEVGGSCEAASNGLQERLVIPASDVPSQLSFSSSFGIEAELEALANAPLGPQVDSLKYTGQEDSGGVGNSKPPFDPRMLEGKLRDASPRYLERLGKDVDKLYAPFSSGGGPEKKTPTWPLMMSAALGGLLSKEQQKLIRGGQEAAASLTALSSVKKTLTERLALEREQMDAGWSKLRELYSYPNRSCPPRTLLATLFSTDVVKDLSRLTKISSSRVESLAAALGLLMLRSTRIAQLDLCVSQVQDLCGQFNRWLVRALRCAMESTGEWPTSPVGQSSRPAQTSSSNVQPIRNALSAHEEGGAVMSQLESLPEGQRDVDEERGDLEAVLNELLRASAGVFALMQATRVHGSFESGSFNCDIRSLLVEYHAGFLLRERQFQISESLAKKAIDKKSVVQQMIMGAGKSTVIGPLLGLMLADGKQLVMVICPEALLPMSRDCLTGILGSVLGRRVYNFAWTRQKLDGPKNSSLGESVKIVEGVVDQVVTIRQKMERAARDQSCFITTPSCVKTFFLQHVCAMVDASKVDPALTLPGTELKKRKWGESLASTLTWFRAREWVSDEMARVLNFWKQRCTVVIDEVDLVLHPLKSELNFPIGKLEPLQPEQQRYTMPMFLLQAPLAAAQDKWPPFDALNDKEATKAAERVRAAILEGTKDFSVMCNPNLVIMSNDWYKLQLQEPMGEWALVFLQRCLKADKALVKEVQQEYTMIHMKFTHEGATPVNTPPTPPAVGSRISTDPGNSAQQQGVRDRNMLKQHKDDAIQRWRVWWEKNRSTLLLYVGAKGTMQEQQNACGEVQRWPLTPHSIQVLNKCREWIRALLPHCLSKRNRIDYGLLVPVDEPKEKASQVDQATRQVMAVPFTGKDRPSHAAEFASPDVAIGLTYLAYHYEGLREFMFYILAQQLKEEMMKEPGPFNTRPHWKQFQDWVDEAKDKKPKVEVLPLDLFVPGDKDQLTQLALLLKDLSACRDYFLERLVFAKTCYLVSEGGLVKVRQVPGTQAMMTRLSSSSMDIGGEMLFNTRIGFTGTPSEVLPRAFENENKERCVYEEKNDAEIICTLTSKEHVSVQIVERGHPAGESGKPGVVWSVESLLSYISTNAFAKKWFALIDTGALTTGYDNLGIAKELMNRGLRKDGFKGVVYLDEKDSKCALMADGRERVPFATCGLQPNERFTFFDQAHCTGMDIKQVPNAVGVATLGKGMTLRDHAQACWRLRQFGKGQKIVLLVIPEVWKQVDRINAKLPEEKDDQQRHLRDIMAWLLDGQIASEHTQQEALALQQLRDCWRQDAMRSMLSSTQPPIYKKGDKVLVQAPREDDDDEKELEVLGTPRGAQELRTVKIHWPGDEEPSEVKLQRLRMAEDCNRMRTRFYEEPMGADETLVKRLTGLEKRVKKATNISLETKNEEEQGPGDTTDAAAEAAKFVEDRMEEAMKKVLASNGEVPSETLKRSKKELRDMLTKPSINVENWDVLYTALYVQRMKQDKIVIKERKSLVNLWCKHCLAGELDNDHYTVACGKSRHRASAAPCVATCRAPPKRPSRVTHFVLSLERAPTCDMIFRVLSWCRLSSSSSFFLSSRRRGMRRMKRMRKGTGTVGGS